MDLGIKQIGFETFRGLPDLKEISLTGNQLGEDSDLGGLRGLETLKFLDLSKNQFTRLSRGMLGSNPTLRNLGISLNPLTSLDDGFVEDFPKLDHIRVSSSLGPQGLRIHGCGGLILFKDDAGVLRRQGHDTEYCQTTLHLHGWGLRGLGSQVFQGIKDLKVNLSHNMLTALDPPAFDGIMKLVALDISHNNLTEIPKSILSALSAGSSVPQSPTYGFGGNPWGEFSTPCFTFHDCPSKEWECVVEELTCAPGDSSSTVQAHQLPVNIVGIVLCLLEACRMCQENLAETGGFRAIFALGRLGLVVVFGARIVNWIRIFDQDFEDWIHVPRDIRECSITGLNLCFLSVISAIIAVFDVCLMRYGHCSNKQLLQRIRTGTCEILNIGIAWALLAQGALHSCPQKDQSWKYEVLHSLPIISLVALVLQSVVWLRMIMLYRRTSLLPLCDNSNEKGTQLKAVPTAYSKPLTISAIELLAKSGTPGEQDQAKSGTPGEDQACSLNSSDSTSTTSDPNSSTLSAPTWSTKLTSFFTTGSPRGKKISITSNCKGASPTLRLTSPQLFKQAEGGGAAACRA